MYDHRELEKHWQNFWKVNKTFLTTNKHAKKCYVLDMFPYPSGSGLHVGHLEGYTASDIIARYKRLNGFDVLHPIGWDAFGLPAEQYALQTGNHPASFTEENIANFRRQLQMMGFSYDYEREVNTTDPQYYRQTQWIFAKLFENNLAERKNIEVNWCPELGTVLANEEVLINDKGQPVSERGGFLVVKKPMMQWVLKITNYANQLYDGLAMTAFPESLKNLQKNWIYDENRQLHLRDWIFSRQRYWGEPIPIYFDDQGRAYVEKNLPLKLPEVAKIVLSGDGQSPLVNCQDWIKFQIGDQTFYRETNTMPQWAGSSWYFLAYILKNPDGTYLDLESAAAKERLKKWLPVDIYIGGQEHAVLHLLYARFWHRFLFDLKVVPSPEPFYRVINQGMILGPDHQKMSKSRGNVVNPDQIVYELGADTLRVYEMFMGPLEDTKPWSTESMHGIRKWLDRVKRVYDSAILHQGEVVKINPKADAKEIIASFHSLVKGVSEDIENIKFNLAIAKMMTFVNDLYRLKELPSSDILVKFAVLLSPFAPHLAEQCLFDAKAPLIHEQTWPTYDATNLKVPQIIIAVQVNGKLRHTLVLEQPLSSEELQDLALANETIKRFLANTTIEKVVYVPHKILNFVVK